MLPSEPQVGASSSFLQSSGHAFNCPPDVRSRDTQNDIGTSNTCLLNDRTGLDDAANCACRATAGRVEFTTRIDVSNSLTRSSSLAFCRCSNRGCRRCRRPAWRRANRIRDSASSFDSAFCWYALRLAYGRGKLSCNFTVEHANIASPAAKPSHSIRDAHRWGPDNICF